MLKEQKERVVEQLAQRLRDSETLIVADYRGLTMPEIDELRSRLLEAGARFTVVKNTLTRRAAEAAGKQEVLDLIDGPTAIAFLEPRGRPRRRGEGAERHRQDQRRARDPRRRARGHRGRRRRDQAARHASVRRTSCAAQLVGAIAGPLTTVVGLFTAPLRDLVGVLDARIRQLEEQGETEPEPEPEAEAEAGGSRRGAARRGACRRGAGSRGSTARGNRRPSAGETAAGGGARGGAEWLRPIPRNSSSSWGR